MPSTKSDRELLLHIQRDDMVAFYHLYNRYSKRIYGFVIRYVKHDQDAEEIMQEVFVSVWETRKKIDPDSSFEAYLFTIAYNRAISLLRKKISEKKYLDYLQSLQKPEIAIDVMSEIYSREISAKVNDLLKELTPQQKLIYTLSREEGLTNKEIAEKLDITVNTVKKHIANTLRFLKTKL